MFNPCPKFFLEKDRTSKILYDLQKTVEKLTNEQGKQK